MRARASSITISVWIHTSPSGCHSGSCRQPMSACISGNSRSITPASRANWKPCDGRAGSSRSFSNSPQTRSGGQVVERDAAADLQRVGRGRQLEAGDELHRAQHAQAVVAERGRVDHAQHARVEVRASAARIEVLVGERIPRDRVDREVAAARRLVERHARVALDEEAAVAAADLRLAAGQRDVDVARLVDREALADGLDRAEPLEQGAKRRGRHAEHLEVDVLGRVAEQAVAHPPADDQRAPAFLADGARDRPGTFDGGDRRPHRQMVTPASYAAARGDGGDSR